MNKVAKQYLEIAIEREFTPEELEERKRHIATLRNFNAISIEAGEALKQIRDKHLYRPHKNLRDFCEKECGWSVQRAYQLMQAAHIVSALPTKLQPLVESERQARELARVPEQQRVEVLEQAEKAGKITAQSIASAASTLHADTPTTQLEVDEMGYPIPKNALPYWNRRPEAKMVLGQIRAAKAQIKKLAPEDPMWSCVNLNGVLGDLGSAINRFEAGVPAYVCLYCQGKNTETCTACKGKGTMSQYEWNLAPQEYKKMREAECRRTTKT